MFPPRKVTNIIRYRTFKIVILVSGISFDIYSRFFTRLFGSIPSISLYIKIQHRRSLYILYPHYKNRYILNIENDHKSLISYFSKRSSNDLPIIHGENISKLKIFQI